MSFGLLENGRQRVEANLEDREGSLGHRERHGTDPCLMNRMWLADYRRAEDDTQWIRVSTIRRILSSDIPGCLTAQSLLASTASISRQVPSTASAKSLRTFVDPAFALDEFVERLRRRFVPVASENSIR